MLVMNENEALRYGRQVRRAATAAYLRGDVGSIVLNSEWQVADKSYRLGIVDAQGCIAIEGPIARAFVRGFRGR